MIIFSTKNMEKLDSHMTKNILQSLPHTMYKNYWFIAVIVKFKTSIRKYKIKVVM